MSRLLGQDILLAVCLLKPDQKWSFQSQGEALGVSASQCHLSYKRLVAAKLVDSDQRLAIRRNLLELLVHGVKYLFPAEPAEIVKGIPTAHSAPFWEGKLIAPEGSKLVWAHPRGRIKGARVEPIYKTVPEVARQDKKVYAILALVDSLRLGKPREKAEASKILEEIIYAH